MSDTDSFIDEVNEEVRRDRLYGLLRRYGWIAVVVILGIVGAAAWSEYRKAANAAEAQALGDAIIAALAADDAAGRADRLSMIETDDPGAAAVTGLLAAAAETGSDRTDAAVDRLSAIAQSTDIPDILVDIAAFKSLILQADTASVEDRRAGFGGLATPGAPLRLLAEEQLAILDLEAGDADAAIARFQSILLDAEAGRAQQQRVTQLILALGGEPRLRQIDGMPGEQG